jgi:hypothetical protein
MQRRSSLKSSFVVLEYFYYALHSERGWRVVCEDGTTPEQVRQRLYAVRRAVNDPLLSELSIVVIPYDPGTVWIVHRRLECEQNQDPSSG